MLANAHKLAGSRRRILPDLPVVMKKEGGGLPKRHIKSEKMKNYIQE